MLTDRGTPGDRVQRPAGRSGGAGRAAHIDEPLLPLLVAAASGELGSAECRSRPDPHVGVVLASRGYPGAYETGKAVLGLEEAARLPDLLVFHAGTANRAGQVVTAGGRVLTVVGRGPDYASAMRRAYEGVAQIDFDGNTPDSGHRPEGADPRPAEAGSAELGACPRNHMDTLQPLKYTVVTAGCRLNQADSLALEREFLAFGCTAAPADTADLVVVNTCTVTSVADHGARHLIRRLARANPSARLVVTGCYATRRPAEVAALPGVAQVFANEEKPFVVSRTLGTRPAPAEGDIEFSTPLVPGDCGHTRCYLRVQTGCDERCAYCIVPSTRGPSRSVPPAEVKVDTSRLAASGFREFVLTGVHLGAYGRDLRPQTSLTALLDSLLELPAGLSFRLSSLEPMDCRPDLIEIACHNRRIAPHFHLPLQHGSDVVLRAMGRPYTVDQYRGLVATIKARLPHAAIGSDVIAGYPGEREADFRCTLDYLERLRAEPRSTSFPTRTGRARRLRVCRARCRAPSCERGPRPCGPWDAPSRDDSRRHSSGTRGRASQLVMARSS